jgi:hypothetical protein
VKCGKIHVLIRYCLGSNKNEHVTFLAKDFIGSLSDAVRDYRLKHEISNNYGFHTETFLCKSLYREILGGIDKEANTRFVRDLKMIGLSNGLE